MTSSSPGSGELKVTPTWHEATLASALAYQADDRPETVAVRFISPGGSALAGSAIATLTFAELHERAASVASVLAERAEPGDRAVLLCPPGLEYVAALFGCFCAGVVAVPAYPPTSAAPDERLARLIGDSRPTTILTTMLLAAVCEPIRRQAAAWGTDLRVVHLDALEPREGSARSHASTSDDLALLQYTSGSTGDPGGVMLTHANLMANVSSCAARFYLASDDRGVSWLPPYHDMGLGAILTSVVLGAESTLMSPLSFLANPLLWLEAVSRYRGTFSGAPNFAYDLCVRKVGVDQVAELDLSSWKSLVNGAEPVRAETIDRFAAHFAPAGFRRSAFRPAYGLAEATLLVSAATLGAYNPPRSTAHTGNGGGAGAASSRADTLVSVGVPDDDTRLLIVDPETRRALPDGEVGEIWFSGPTVGAGYWGSPERSEATFAATLVEDPDGTRFLRTGDLGELRGGELYVRGRIKDLIIVRGRNYHPHDIELAATTADSALRPGCLAAFETERGRGQEVILVAELARELEDATAGNALFERVRARVGRDVGLALDELVLIERGASLKTSSGKIRRSATCAAYLEGALPILKRYRSSRAAVREDHTHARARIGERAAEAVAGGAGETRALRRRRLAQLAPREREKILRELVLTELSALLGDVPAKASASRRTFNELGLESVDAVELSSRLRERTGIELPETLCFEHPTPAALVSYLSWRLGGAPKRRRLAPGRSPATGEPVAIVGMGCRFPGGVDSPESLWRLVGRGGDAISQFPRDRGWDLERLVDADPDRPGSSHAREGGFIGDAAGVDAGFFGIGPSQADAIDPQQRLLLEVAWEALEDAGIDPRSLAGSATAVFAGVSSIDHAIRLGVGRSRELEAQLLTGAAASAVSGRVAYALGLKGAAVTVDTACSSSLVALHEACRALADGECSLALAGGVTVLSTPAIFTGFSRQGALAADGRCKPFAAGADGTGFSEGAGLLVLEGLRDAQGRGHRVLALVRGSAVNQDGQSNGFTAPSPSSQEDVIRAALAAATLSPQDVDAVEAHGTGTVLGDPIEAQALIATYGQGRTRPLWLGSVKSNLGHTQAAAGVASVIKMVMALRHGVLPKTLHVDEPSPRVDWQAGAVRLLRSAREWPASGRSRRAGISSFGISGTNAHLILEETAPSAEPERTASSPTLPFLLSAKSGSALRRQAERLRSHLDDHEDLAPLDVAYTLASGRARLEHRAAIVGGDREALLRGLDAVIEDEFGGWVLRGRAPESTKVAFVFGGQGAQWEGMARELLDSSALFAHRLRACAAALSPHLEWSLEDVLRGASGAPALERVDVVQPALWAVMVSLAELWRSFGVQPSVVVGHSQGEIAAAHIAGGLSLEDAARLVALRSQALREIEGAGDMVSLALGAKEAGRLIARFSERVSLAAENGPSATVVSGEIGALEELLELCEAEGIGARRIAVGFASHSGQVEAIRERFVRSLAPLRPHSGEVPFLSCAAAGVVSTSDLDGEYWYRSLREPVRFTEATRALLHENCSVLIEMSPHPVLAVPMQDTADEEGAGREVAVIGSLRRGERDGETFLRSLGEAFVHGVEVDWTPLFSAQRARLVALPTYPFERKRHWLMPHAADGERSGAGVAGHRHPLLGASVSLADRDAWLHSGRLSLQTHPRLAGHTVLGSAVLPASALLELALYAGSEAGCEEVEELTLEAPLVLPEEGALELQVSVSEPDEDGRRALLIASRPEPEGGGRGPEWRQHARGTLAAAGRIASAQRAPEAWPPAGAEEIEVGYLHDRMAELGVSYGPALGRLRAAWQLGDEIFAELARADEDADTGFLVDPALVDSILQAASVKASARAGVLMPFAWRGVRAQAAGSEPLRARLRVAGDSLTLEVSDADGAAVLSVEEILMRPLDAAHFHSVGSSERELLLGLRWVTVSAPARGEERRGVGVLGDLEIGPSGAPRYANLSAVADATAAGGPLSSVLAAVSADEQSAAGAHEAAQRALALLQSWLSDERLRDLRLVLFTTGAVAARDGEAPNLAGAAVWGLVRSAQAEQPGRFTLVDVDGTGASWGALERALALSEPQLALRDGALLVPRLSRLKEPAATGRLAPDRDGTVLITGGTGELGRLFARHLVHAHGVRHLLLASRSGPGAPGAAECQAELAELGCDARVVACDVADRGALERLLGDIPQTNPLTAVVHAAGILDDGLFESLDPERLDRVLAPKVDAAIALDELTTNLELSAFVLISSAVATLGGAGQANYAAANAVLDAVAQARRARGLPGQSLAFGLWQRNLGAGPRADALAHLESQIRARMGMLALEPERGLALFDASLAAQDAILVPVRMDMEVLRGNARVDATSPVLDGLVSRPKGREDSARALRRRLLAAASGARDAIVRELISEEAGSVVGCDSSEVGDERTLIELGGESLDALELRNRLQARTGVRLATRLFFGQPLRALADRLREAIEEDLATHRRASAERSSTLRTLLESAREMGTVAELVSMLMEASRRRASFDSVAELPHALQLTSAGHGPRLICIPSFMPGSGPHQFARLARGFNGIRSLTALHLPGWRMEERAPATWAVAIEALCAAVRAAAAEEPYVLVGYSSGGALAHALAERCEAEDCRPAGVVMIDTYAPGDGSVFAAMLGEIIDRSHEQLEIDDDELIAMGTFMRLASEWQAGVVSAPALYLRAAAPLAAVAGSEPMSAPFQEPQGVVSLDADHFTIIEEHAQASASAIERWLCQLAGRDNGTRATQPVAAVDHGPKPGS